jgi:hypothetical protein
MEWNNKGIRLTVVHSGQVCETSRPRGNHGQTEKVGRLGVRSKGDNKFFEVKIESTDFLMFRNSIF